MNKTDIKNLFSNIDLTIFKRFRKDVPYLVFLIGIALVYFFYLNPRNAKLSQQVERDLQAAHADIDRIKAEIEASEGLKKNVDNAVAALKKADEKIKNLGEKLPSKKRVSKILAEIAGYDTSGGVRILSVKPMPMEEKGDLIRLPFQITLEARFHSFGEYLERLENLQRVMIVDNFLIETKDDGKGLLTAQMYLSAYVLSTGKL